MVFIHKVLTRYFCEETNDQNPKKKEAHELLKHVIEFSIPNGQFAQIKQWSYVMLTELTITI